MEARLWLSWGEDGRVVGSVARDGGPAVAFDGWLELLRLLEADAGAPPDEPPAVNG